MSPASLDILQVGLVLIGSLLGSRAQSSRLIRNIFFVLLAVSSVYIGYVGLNMLSPVLAKTSSISAANRHALAITYCSAAAASGVLLMPSTRRLLVRLSGWNMETPLSFLGVWLFVVVFLINVATIIQLSAYYITISYVGLDQHYQLFNTLLQQLCYILIALIGAGIYYRRRPRAVFQRLGVLPQEQEVAALGEEEAQERISSLDCIGSITVVALGSLALGLGGILLVKTFMYQLYLPLSFAFSTMLPPPPGSGLLLLATALGIGIVASAGEELLFRGLLQPTFGLVPTALLFTALHGQYGLSPALGFIFLQGLGYGWLRNRYGTWASLAAHVVYTTVAVLLWWMVFR